MADGPLAELTSIIVIALGGGSGRGRASNARVAGTRALRPRAGAGKVFPESVVAFRNPQKPR